eukprot:5645857-Prymnesium_polylepis.1
MCRVLVGERPSCGVWENKNRAGVRGGCSGNCHWGCPVCVWGCATTGANRSLGRRTGALCTRTCRHIVAQAPNDTRQGGYLASRPRVSALEHHNPHRTPPPIVRPGAGPYPINR